jgi:hypothetical protein
MMEVCPPGAFALCANSAFEQEALRLLKKAAGLVREATQGLGAVGLILTGSFARGEATLVSDSNAGTRWLSDVECLLAFRASRSTQTALFSAVRRIEDAMNNDAANLSRGVRIELSPISVRQLARLRPGIFTRELAEHGKLLWGDPVALRSSRQASGAVEIPIGDGFRLLNNRIVEQVAARLASESGSFESLATGYEIHKFWNEIITSLSVFLGCYRTSYRERQESVESVLEQKPGLLDPGVAEIVIRNGRQAIAAKCGVAGVKVAEPYESFRIAARTAAIVWDWESRRMLRDDCPSFGWDSVVTRLRRLEPLGQRARDWARLLIRPERRDYRKVSVLKTAFCAGSFANVIYASGCLLDFFWEEIGIDGEAGRRISALLRNLLHVGHRCAATRRELAESTVAAWERHLRFAAA